MQYGIYPITLIDKENLAEVEVKQPNPRPNRINSTFTFIKAGMATFKSCQTTLKVNIKNSSHDVGKSRRITPTSK